MVTRILPKNGNPKHTLKGRLKGTVAGFAGAVAWLIAAGIIPYETLTPYWPEAGRWGPVILFALAAFNLLKGLYNLAWAARLFSSKPPRLAAPFRERGRTGTPTAEARPGTPRPGAQQSARHDGPGQDRSHRAAHALRRRRWPIGTRARSRETPTSSPAS